MCARRRYAPPPPPLSPIITDFAGNYKTLDLHLLKQTAAQLKKIALGL